MHGYPDQVLAHARRGPFDTAEIRRAWPRGPDRAWLQRGRDRAACGGGRVGGRAAQMTSPQPDTRGMNFFHADRSLRELLELYLPADELQHLTTQFPRVGDLVGGALAALAIGTEPCGAGECKSVDT